MKDDLSIIITLFKTPDDKLKILNQYKSYPILIFDQATKDNSKYISKIINTKFEYYYSEKNLGLCKSTNFLISKVKTKYFLFTQADIEIDENSISNLIKGMNIRNDIIFAGMPGGWEIALIALVILLIFGAKRLPGLARGLGQGIREFKGAVDGVKDELKDVQESVDTPEEDKEV